MYSENSSNPFNKKKNIFTYVFTKELFLSRIS